MDGILVEDFIGNICQTHKCPYMLIDDRYEIPLDLF